MCLSAHAELAQCLAAFDLDYLVAHLSCDLNAPVSHACKLCLSYHAELAQCLAAVELH
jgi:hypothetical protein